MKLVLILLIVGLIGSIQAKAFDNGNTTAGIGQVSSEYPLPSSSSTPYTTPTTSSSISIAAPIGNIGLKTDDSAPCPADLPSASPIKGKDCTRDYKPVCGSNGQTYSNQCEFDNAHLRDPNLTMTRNGSC